MVAEEKEAVCVSVCLCLCLGVGRGVQIRPCGFLDHTCGPLDVGAYYVALVGVLWCF